jgi:AraC-like DNA-binding protein
MAPPVPHVTTSQSQTWSESQVQGLLCSDMCARASCPARTELAYTTPRGYDVNEQLASQLHMSARTLHRRLEQEGTNYRRVLTDTILQCAT